MEKKLKAFSKLLVQVKAKQAELEKLVNATIRAQDILLKGTEKLGQKYADEAGKFGLRSERAAAVFSVVSDLDDLAYLLPETMGSEWWKRYVNLPTTFTKGLKAATVKDAKALAAAKKAKVEADKRAAKAKREAAAKERAAKKASKAALQNATSSLATAMSPAAQLTPSSMSVS